MNHTSYTKAQAEEALRRISDDAAFGRGIDPRNWDAGGMDDDVEQYAALATEGAREQHISNVVASLRDVDEDLMSLDVGDLEQTFGAFYNASAVDLGYKQADED